MEYSGKDIAVFKTGLEHKICVCGKIRFIAWYSAKSTKKVTSFVNAQALKLAAYDVWGLKY
jgi:hypothetical protein